jgi:hypothetical protein
MSTVEKEILIKGVGQAIPTYAMEIPSYALAIPTYVMACFDLSKSLCDDISKMICQYWWSQNDEVKKMHWVGWKKVKLPKEEGGLGFRDLHSFNMLAILVRKSWRLIQSPDSLCACVLGAKYFPGGDILSDEPQTGTNYAW